jgi:hypothetical protein
MTTLLIDRNEIDLFEERRTNEDDNNRENPIARIALYLMTLTLRIGL